MFVIDPRLDQVQKIVESLVTKSLLPNTNCLVTSDNTLVLLVDETLLYIIHLRDELCYPSLGFSYSKFMYEVSSRSITDFNISSLDIYDTLITTKLLNYYASYYGYIFEEAVPVAVNNDLKTDESFSDYLNIKSDDGMKYYRLPALQPGKQYMIPIFTGFPNITSQDKLGIYVYDIGNSFLIGRFKIFKKKINRDINIFFRMLDITGGILR